MTRSANRGPDPQDVADFAPHHLPALTDAVSDLSWLLGRGYAEAAAQALVGNHRQLTLRQRHAVMRCACADDALARRRAHRVDAAGLAGNEVALDGFNVIIALERALSGGPVLRGRDGAIRDLAGVHGTWRERAPTAEAVERIGAHLAEHRVRAVRWWLDAPVSNSGRLAARLRAAATAHGWPWEVELTPSADGRLVEAGGVVATSDGWILDHCEGWYGLAGALIDEMPDAWVVDLGVPAARP